MKIISRYILKEIIPPFILGFLFFTFILFIGVLFNLTRLIFVEKASPLLVGKLILFSLPVSFDIVIPISLLFAILISFGRLSFDGEIIALQSSGVSFFQIEKLLLVFIFLLTGISLVFSAYLTPWSNQNYKKLYQEIVLKKPTIQIKENTIIDFQGKKIYTSYVNSQSQEMENIIIYEFLPGRMSKFPQITLSEKGKFEKEKLELKKINLYRFGNNRRITQQGKFNSEIIYLKNQTPEGLFLQKDTPEMNLGEIKKYLEKEKRKKVKNIEKIRELSLDFHSRLSLPLSTIFLALLAIPLGIKMERGERSIGLGISCILVTIYYLFFIAGRALGKGGVIPPLIAMWIPNIIIGSLAIWLNLILNKK